MQNKILGYQEIQDSILTSFVNNKLHHAIILSGIDGIGKFSFVKELSRKITGSNLSSENNPDILIIKKSLNTKGELRKDIVVDDVRRISNFIDLSSSVSDCRVIIVDGIDYFNKSAANAILKNLEEPPSNVFFFLINHNLNKISDTIRSRCSLIMVNSPKFKEFSDIILNNNLKITSEELNILFEVSGGSISNAIDFHDNNFLEHYKKIVFLLTNCDANLRELDVLDSFIKIENGIFLFENIVFLLINRAIKISNNILKSEFFESELFLLSEYLDKNGVDNIFMKKDKISEILLNIGNLNLDKRQSLVNILNIL